MHFDRVICDVWANVSFVCWLLLFQLCRTILDPDDRTQKAEYLEIGVYRTTPLMPDRGLVGDNRSSKVFEFATFSSSTQSRWDFFSLSLSFSLITSPPPTSNKIREGYFPLFARFSFFPFLFRISAISPSFVSFFFSPHMSPSALLHLCCISCVPVSIRYTVVDTARFVVAVVHGRRQAAFRWRLRFDV